jgi:acid stress-induced BolA-like protein IbaG/YrbA
MPAPHQKKTPETRQIERLLRSKFPRAEAYRYNSASIRVRVIDSRFAGQSRTEREEQVLPLIRQLPEETQADVMILLMLTPDELARSLMNLEFENPTPSMV